MDRFRSRILRMQKSSELEEITGVMYQQLDSLGIVPEGAMVYIVIVDTKTDTSHQWIVTDGTLIRPPEGELRIPMTEDPRLIKTYEAWKRKDPLLIRDLSGDELEDFKKYLKSLPSLQGLESDIDQWPDRLVWSEASFSNGTLGFICQTPLPAATLAILVRFSKDFDLAYTRFLDLQKAEAQAREAQIEAALERVRSRSMAMHLSKELSEVAYVVFEQVKNLGFEIYQSWNTVLHEQEGFIEMYITDFGGKHNPNQIKVPISTSPIVELVEEWKRGAPFLEYEFKGTEVKNWFDLIHSLTGDPLFILKEYPESSYSLETSTKYGAVSLASLEPLNPEIKPILSRFAKVFEQTYTRFLDLQKAEGQAREAQIEAALERVRSRTMAMQKSEELAAVATILFQQVKALGVPQWACGFSIFEIDDKEFTWYQGGENDNVLPPNKIPLTEHPVFIQFNESRKRGDELYVYEKEGEVQKDHYRYMMTIPVLGEILQGMLDAGYEFPTFQIDHVANFSHGNLVFITYEHFPEMHDTFKRFAKVFDQTYTRFLDLQKAEAQAREAQIEAALERVRSRSMAMHKSEELQEVINQLFIEIESLGVPMGSFYIVTEVNKDMTKGVYIWVQNNVNLYAEKVHLAYLDHPLFHKFYKAWWDKTPFYSEIFDKKDKNRIFNHLFKHSKQLSAIPAERKKYVLDGSGFSRSVVFYKNVAFIIQKYDDIPFKPEDIRIQKRFGGVFEQTYTRFLDLQKAETQTREAKIEASLERVRAKAMAMHTSEAVGGAISVLFHELENLGSKPMRCGIIIFTENTTMQTWTTSTEGVDQTVNISGEIDMTLHPLTQGVFNHWKSGEKLFKYTLEGQDAADYYQALDQSPNYKLPVRSVPKDKHYLSVFLFKEGGLFVFTKNPIISIEENLYQRFTKVFTLTYRRYQDLKAAELRAREAVKQSSLDRVRGEVSSMRTKDDLNRITPLVWKELNTLGVPFIRCGVFIIDEKENLIHTYLSTPDGLAIGTFHIPLDKPGNLAIAIDHWRQQKMFVTFWAEKEFKLQADQLVEQGAIATPEQYLNSIPKDGFHLHFSPFSQGMLYVGSMTPLQSDDLQLVQALTNTFSVAYARYEDFSKLEEAKKSVDAALTELKSTQSQLIQSEKMASLGELTAGIAHEIQNPLNFVNNFSELNEELIAELRDELKKGNLEEVENIVEDLFRNEEKIKHHGKRAESIVKNMLQHSRSSSGQKEPTDINALCDEYLRLAYHGMRAKDKSFNATIEMHFDLELPPVEVIPQDIGRVLLNLINNAFQACAEQLAFSLSKGSVLSAKALAAASALSSDLSDETSVKSEASDYAKASSDKLAKEDSLKQQRTNLTDLAESSAAANLSDLHRYKPLVSIATNLSP